jgi:hypothetical protein
VRIGEIAGLRLPQLSIVDPSTTQIDGAGDTLSPAEVT